MEGELLLAAATLRRIKEQNYGSPAKNKLSRISRTDRGVSALANCVSFKVGRQCWRAGQRRLQLLMLPAADPCG